MALSLQQKYSKIIKTEELKQLKTRKRWKRWKKWKKNEITELESHNCSLKKQLKSKNVCVLNSKKKFVINDNKKRRMNAGNIAACLNIDRRINDAGNFVIGATSLELINLLWLKVDK